MCIERIKQELPITKSQYLSYKQNLVGGRRYYYTYV